MRYITYLLLLCIVLLNTGCESDLVRPVTSSTGEGDATLALKISIGGSKSIGGTRAQLLPTDDPYELIHTLRVIIMRPDNTVEFNRMVNMPLGVGFQEVGGLEFKVSTSQGEITESDGNVKIRTEKKRIYLVANEASIPNEHVKNMLVDLREGYYKKVDDSGQTGASEVVKDDYKVDNEYVPGDTFLPSTSADILIYNQWVEPDETTGETYAVPMVDNEATVKKFVPMTEFFDISVSSDITNPNRENIQKHDLFITRNLVKFEFEIDAAEGTESFAVTDITVGSFMQKEYLFPHDVVYSPRKYEADGTVNLSDKEILSYATPGAEDNLIRPYLFRPVGFGFNKGSEDGATTNYSNTYCPALYFCESKPLRADETGVSLFDVSIGVEFDGKEPVLDKNGEPLLDNDGNQIYERPKRKFDAKDLTLPYMLPRNTIVRVKMKLNEGVLSCEATVYPYTAVNLNPEFGFTPPETDFLTVAPVMEINMAENKDGLLYPKFTSTAGNKINKIIWVSSDPSVILLGPEVNDPDPESQMYVRPAESIELPYYGTNDEVQPVRVIPQRVDTAYVTAYTITGLVARCQVIVK